MIKFLATVFSMLLIMASIPAPLSAAEPSYGGHFNAQIANCKPVPETNQQACISLATGLQYWLNIPDSPAQDLPVLIYLHGSNRSGSQLGTVLSEGIPYQLEHGRRLPMIVVSPQCPLGDNWQTPAMVERLSHFVDEIVATYHADSKRVYLTGFSMGGDGVWALGIAHPEQFRALAPVASWYSNLDAVCAVQKIPVWVFQSDMDEVVSPHFAADMTSALNRCNGNVMLTRYSSGSHQRSAQVTYQNDALYSWFLDQKSVGPNGDNSRIKVF